MRRYTESLDTDTPDIDLPDFNANAIPGFPFGEVIEDIDVWENTIAMSGNSGIESTVHLLDDNLNIIVESLEYPYLTAYTRIYDDQGQQNNTVDLKDFFSYRTLINGSSVYHLGITGEYTGVEGTAATLTHHQVR